MRRTGSQLFGVGSKERKLINAHTRRKVDGMRVETTIDVRDILYSYSAYTIARKALAGGL